ncbi:MAG: hypothetical protein ABEK17_00265 [Candidatus Aenigmatarchaeota archaeon]
MFLTLKESKCPLCGTEANENEKIPEVNDCPKCGTVFSKFGIVIAFQKELNLEWN